MIITGATSGLGYETSRKVVADPEVQLVLACRNPEKAQETVETIRKETGNEHVRQMHIDLASLQSVRDFANSYKESDLGKIYHIMPRRPPAQAPKAI